MCIYSVNILSLLLYIHLRDYKIATHKGEKKFKGKVIKIKKYIVAKKF